MQIANVNMDENLGYLIGFIIGDGNLSKKYLIRACDADKDFMEKIFVQKFKAAFKIAPRIYFDRYNNSFVAYTYSEEAWKTLKRFGVLPGTKSRNVRILKSLKESKIRCSIVSGLFDAEGSVIQMIDNHHKNGYLRIQLKVHNRGLAKDIFDILNAEKIKARIYNYDKFSILQINGKQQCYNFNKTIGFKHPKKTKKLTTFLLTRYTGQGVHFCGKDNLLSRVSAGKPIST